MVLLRKAALSLAIGFGVSLAIPSFAEGSAPQEMTTCKKKRRSKKKRRRRASKKRRSKKKRITSKTIKRWQKKGMDHDEIVERALAKGYKPTKRNLRRLKRARVKKSLIRKFAAVNRGPTPATAVADAPPKARPIELPGDDFDPNSIDFDSIAPPSGVPDRYRTEGKPRSRRARAAPTRTAPTKRRKKPVFTSKSTSGGSASRRPVIAGK